MQPVQGVILRETDLRKAVAYFLTQDSFVFDIEGQGDYRDQPHIADISWISLATNGCCITVPMMHERGEENGTTKVPEIYKTGKKIGQIYMKTVPTFDQAPEQIERSRVFEILEPLFSSTTIAKAGHDVLYDIVGVSKYLGFIPPPPYNDTKIGKWLLNENNRRNTWLKEIIEDTYEVRYDHEGIGKCVESYPFSTVSYYSYSDAKWDWLVLQDVLRELESQGLMSIYNLEMHVLNVMCGMRVAGVSIDVPRLKEIREELKERLVKSEAEIYQAAGKKFNIGSNLQKTEILFGPESDGNQGLKPWKLTKTGMDLKKAGKLPNPVPLKYWSTDDAVMESYPDNRLCCAFRDHGDIAKILSTYVESWLGNDEDLPKVIDSKIYAGFQQYGTVTGRFSCVSADTLVESPRDMSKFPDGIPITEIKTGDWVYAFDHKRELRLRKVVWCGQTGVKKTLIVTAENSEGHQKKIRVTPEHLIMLRNGDWRAAEHLMHAPGELIELYSGKLDYRVISIEDGPVEPVWDMEVEELHNFIANGICVHNCRAPNLQNLPRSSSELGKMIRDVFIAEPGGKLVVADYSQMELVILAHYIGEGKLYEAFMQGIDPHLMTAAMVLGREPRISGPGDGGVTPVERQDLGKTLGFAVVYGAGLGKVSSMAHISFDEAKRVLKMHEKMFPEVHEFKQDVIDLARSRKPVPYITTLLGRKRRIPELNSSNDKLRMGAERQMFNSLIQGGLADLIKLAMIRLDATLPDEAKLVLTVHDEVVVSCPDSMVTEVENLVREAMTGPGIQKYLRVPMKIEMHSGDSWGECK